MVIVVLGWVIFGAAELNSGLYQIGAMFGIGASAFMEPSVCFILHEYGVFFLLSVFFSTPMAAALSDKHSNGFYAAFVKPFLYLLLMVLCVSFLAMNSNNPFLYFNF